MEKSTAKRKYKVGDSGYINNNCWIVNNLGTNPYKRCQYCESKFHDCMFLHYQLISLALIAFFFASVFLIDGKISQMIGIPIFVLVVVYGYFFNKSTDKIIKANFTQKKAKEALEELSEKLEEKVDEQTKEIKEAYLKIEKSYEMEKRAHRELKRLSEVKNQFLLSTQHHLRSPLTVIQGYLSMISEGDYGKIPKRVDEKIKASLGATRNLIHLVNELLDVAHFQMDKGVVVKKPTDVIELIGGIISDLESVANNKGIYLKLARPIFPVDLINVDPNGIREAMYNIVDNAIKYTQNGGVSISIGVISDWLRITVADTGIGIDPNDKSDIFNRIFERGDKAKEVNVNGKGIGLYLAAQMVNSNGGKIRVKSAGIGKGTVFTIDLPLKSVA
ncbi:MAG: HAMP domain-containing sensor histidine kinase [Candidatus Paceibacterota bacterium]